jgi:hypothetical protein
MSKVSVARLVCSLSLLLVCSCSTASLDESGQVSGKQTKYRDMTPHKAAAVCPSGVRDDSDDTIWFSWAADSATLAETSAVNACQSATKKNGERRCSSACEVLYSDDQLVSPELESALRQHRSNDNLKDAGSVALLPLKVAGLMIGLDPRIVFPESAPSKNGAQTPTSSRDQISSATPPSSNDTNLSGSAEMASPGQACPSTLGYLASSLPQYDDPQLQQVRSQILQTNIADVRQRSLADGYTVQSAAKAALQQAEEFQKSESQAESCLRSASATPDADVAAVKDGTYSFLNRGSSVSAQCAKAWVADYYGYIANRDTAVALVCSSTNGGS